ncbi:MAG: hypothetical protein EPN85_07280 [Bacteroidetes bacterium]|nr:MAG: hypothetical protein EPN85_07280 [Bacteroidota bacterium]
MSKIKFFVTPVYPYSNDHYYHEIIALAEGLIELGHEVTGNANYWFQPEKKSWLLNENASEDYDIAIYDYRYVRSFEHLLFRKGYPGLKPDKIKILVDRNDWISPVWHANKHYLVFDLILAGNLFKNVSYPSNVKPWAIGLTNRIMQSIDKNFNQYERTENVIGHNFRIAHNMREYVLKGLEGSLKKITLQPCFTYAKKNEDAMDDHYWKISTHRHIPEYYKLLNSKLMFASFGGYYEYKPLAYAPYGILDKIKRKPYYWYYKLLLRYNKSIAPAVFVFQYDNFRLWEVLYSRSCAVNLDIESWNFRMPVNPVEGEHYMGIDRFNFNKFAEKIENLPLEQIQSIGLKGREWVLQNYSPVAQAKRMLQHIEILKK